MLLSFNWLKEFVPYTGTAEELGEMLTMLGLELEEVVHPYEGISGLVVGRVLTCEDHPDSDHLHVCKVDVGDEVLQIVCGAPNCRKGLKVIVALPGAIAVTFPLLSTVTKFELLLVQLTFLLYAVLV